LRRLEKEKNKPPVKIDKYAKLIFEPINVGKLSYAEYLKSAGLSVVAVE